MHWHIITGEYPPQPGGVSDYTHLVARALAQAGDQVEVWTCANDLQQVDENGVHVHRLRGQFGPSALALMDRAVSAEPNNRILVQYVPHAFGWKAMNLGFCVWLFARRRFDITVMFHEVAFPRRVAQPLRHNVLGEVTSLMAMLVARSAQRIFVSCLAWEVMLRRLLSRGRRIDWLPVPSSVPVLNDSGSTQALRARYGRDKFLVGHFGTYGPKIRDYLEVVVPELLRTGRINLILLGRGSRGFCETIVRKHPAITTVLYSTDELCEEDLSHHISSCDLMIQPYPDGINGRRTSAMAALAHGRPVLTTVGHLTEPLWIGSGAVAVVPADEPSALGPLAIKLLDDPAERTQLALGALRLYRDYFDLRHTIKAIRTADADCDSQLVQA